VEAPVFTFALTTAGGFFPGVAIPRAPNLGSPAGSVRGTAWRAGRWITV